MIQVDTIESAVLYPALVALGPHLETEDYEINEQGRLAVAAKVLVRLQQDGEVGFAAVDTLEEVSLQTYKGHGILAVRSVGWLGLAGPSYLQNDGIHTIPSWTLCPRP